MHTLFVREHNRLCREICATNPKLDDEEVYQGARRIVGALMQVITYHEFLPALLGANAIPPYRGYDPQINPGVSNEFATACYRVGHSMLPEYLPLRPHMGQIRLRDAFFRPDMIERMGIEPFLDGLALRPMQRVDVGIVEDVRTFLFRRVIEQPKQLLDLAALNIQRGRDHGLADYNAIRQQVGLVRKTTWAEISSDPGVQSRLKRLYGTVDDVDAWVGGLAEDHATGAAVGELILTVLAEQFARARNGDRYWYENDPELSSARRTELNGTTLADVVMRNTGLTALPADVFRVNP